MGIFGVLIDEVLESVTRNLYRVPLKWSSYGISGTCSHYFDSTSLVSRIFVYFICIVFVYLVYAKCLHGLLRRMELSECSRSHFISAVWYASLCGAGIMACVIIFIMDYKVQNLETVYSFFLEEKTFLTENNMTNNLTLFFVIFVALQLHSVCLTWSQRGFEVDFFTGICFILFFCSTYSMRRVLLAMVCILFINMNSVCADLARIFCILGRSKSYQIYSMKYVAYFYFLMHCVFWVGMFLYFLPTHVLFAILHMPTSRANIASLLLMNLMLWSYFWLQLMSAPLPKFMWNLMWNTCSSAGYRDLLDSSLFPARNEVLRELKQIRSRIQKLQEERRRNSFTYFGPTLSHNPECKKTLFQTLRCVMAMKRKLKQKRDRIQNQQNAQSVQSEDSDE